MVFIDFVNFIYKNCRNVSFIVVAATIALSNALWAGPQSDVFRSSLVEFMDAEQRLSTGNPLMTRPTDILGIFWSRYATYGSFPEGFKPTPGVRHKLITLLIPEEDLPHIYLASDLKDDTKKILFVEQNGKRFVRFFILPAPENLAYYSAEIAKYSQDSKVWYGEQQSSGRTLTVNDEGNSLRPFMIKLSINIKTGSISRIISPGQVKRAVLVNELIKNMRRDAESPPQWAYFPEVAGIVGVNGKGGYILREFSQEMVEGDYIALPLLSLVNGKKNPTWLSVLAAASGKPMQRFLVEDIINPLVDMFSQTNFLYGLVSEPHQQNAVLLVNRNDFKDKKIDIRDLDGFSVDRALRRALGRDDSLYFGMSEDELKVQRATRGHYENYTKFLKLRSVLFLLGGSGLEGINASKLLKAADDRLLQNANSVFGYNRFHSISDLKNYSAEVVSYFGSRQLLSGLNVIEVEPTTVKQRTIQNLAAWRATPRTQVMEQVLKPLIFQEYRLKKYNVAMLEASSQKKWDLMIGMYRNHLYLMVRDPSNEQSFTRIDVIPSASGGRIIVTKDVKAIREGLFVGIENLAVNARAKLLAEAEKPFLYKNCAQGAFSILARSGFAVSAMPQDFDVGSVDSKSLMPLLLTSQVTHNGEALISSLYATGTRDWAQYLENSLQMSELRGANLSLGATAALKSLRRIRPHQCSQYLTENF